MSAMSGAAVPFVIGQWVRGPRFYGREAEIALRRERVGASFEELRRRVQGVTSWRQWAASHPLGWIGAGVSLGFIIGCLASGRPRSGP